MATKKPRGLPQKLGANITAAPDAGAGALVSPKQQNDDAEAKREPEAKEELPKDSMRLSSLGDWLSGSKEAQVTSEEKGGIIPGIIAGLDEEVEDDDNDADMADDIFGGALPAELSAVDQFDALTDAVETVLVSLVLCRRRTRFLCVQENDNTWYIPGGTVDAGESFQGAAMRSGLDEANIQIHLDGILRIEYSTSNGVRVRVVFKATPIDPTVLPKQNPDQHSLQAKWLSNLALKKFRLRTETISDMFDWVDSGAPHFPVDLLEYPPFGPERSQIDHEQSVTLLVHRAHLVLMDRKRRVFVLPDKSLPTMTLREGQSFLRFPTTMAQKYCMVLGVDAGNHAVEVLHIWHAPPNPLDSVGLFCVTYLQKVRSDLPSTADSLSLDTVGQLKALPPLKRRVKQLLEGDVETMPLSKFVPEDSPYK